MTDINQYSFKKESLLLFIPCFFFPVISLFLIIKRLMGLRIIHGRKGAVVLGIIYFIPGIILFPGFLASGVKDPALDFSLLGLFVVPWIVCAVLLWLYSSRSKKLYRNAGEIIDFISRGAEDFESVIKQFKINKVQLLILLKDAVYCGILRGYVIDYADEKIISPGRDELSGSGDKISISWKCSNCGANNQAQIYPGDHAVCQYCHAPR